MALLLVSLTLLLPAALPALTLFNTSLREWEGEGTPKADFFRLQTIVIDAGHGGKDPGGIGSEHQEKDIVLSIAKHLAAYIREQYPAIKVILTREDDTFVPLHERAAIANRNHADLFLSIHANIMPNSSATAGSETYVMGQHVAEHNLQVAKRENAAILLESDYQKNYDYDPNSDEGHILMAMYQSAFLEQSILFAELVEKHFAQTALRKSRGVKQAGFVVLKESSMPSVLIEAGFLSNSQEEKYLASKQGQQQMALAIFEAFRAYKHKVEGEEISVAQVPSKSLNSMMATSNGQYATPNNSLKPVFSTQAKPPIVKANESELPTAPSSPPIGSPPTASVMAPSLPPEQIQFRLPENNNGSGEVLLHTGVQAKGSSSAPPSVLQQEVVAPASSPATATVLPVIYQSVNISQQPKETVAKGIRMPTAAAPQLVFAIQLAAAGKEINTNTPKWQQISYPLSVMQEDGLYKYQARGIPDAPSAKAARKKLEEAGFEGAFIVIYRAEEKLSPAETQQILRQ